nr:lanthionine synthetase C family protein [Companilactobacillus allii]
MSNGSMGVIMSLKENNKKYFENSKKWKEWLNSAEKNLLNISENELCDNGLFSGMSGICSVIYENGNQDLSYKLLEKCNFNNKSMNISIYNGLSGIGLSLLSFYSLSNIMVFKNRAIEIANIIVNKINNGKFEEEKESEEKIGLITGWTGAALFLWKTGILLDEKYKKYAIIILEKIVNDNLVNDEQGITFKDDSRGFRRLIPYLDTGSVGIALTLLEMQKDDLDSISMKFSDLLSKLIDSNYSSCSYMSCLFSGVTGFIVLSNAIYKIYGVNKSLKKHILSLNNYAISYDGMDIFPGKLGYKCSMDISTGSAGVMSVLNDVVSNDKWGSWIPLPKSDMNLFNINKAKKVNY